jgi:hypothetical protein
MCVQTYDLLSRQPIVAFKQPLFMSSFNYLLMSRLFSLPE